jgi:aryl-alcohol dehydrogenase-like predicted oxidoreductase
MKYRKLGRTGLDVSVICLGTMTWGRQNSEAEGHEQMDYALEQGINFFDTAELYAVPPNEETYGKTEEIIGTWFNKHNNRDKVILASKVAGRGIPWIRGGDYKIDRKNILEALDASLSRLQTDYIDLYQLHWSNRPNYHFANYWDYDVSGIDADSEKDDFLEILQTLDEQVKAGKIRHVGLSNETAWGTMQYLQLAEKNGLPRMASIQNEYNLINRKFEQDLAEVAITEDVGLLAWSPLAGGMISGKYLGGKRPEGTRWSLDERMLFRDTDQSTEAIKAYIAIAEKYGLDVCKMALSFVNDQAFVTSNIIGATSMEQLKVNIDSINLSLQTEVIKEINEVYRSYPRPF